MLNQSMLLTVQELGQIKLGLKIIPKQRKE